MSTYFITGATGTIGSRVIEALRGSGHQILAASRTSAPSSEGETKPVVFDYREPGTYPAALGTDGLFLLGPPVDMSLYELLAAFVDYLAAKHYAGRIVYLSVYGVDALPELPFHQQMEDKLRQSRLRWNVIRPGFFMDNFGNYERERIEQHN